MYITEKLESIKAEAVKTSYDIEMCGASPELTTAVIQNGRVIDMIKAAIADFQNEPTKLECAEAEILALKQQRDKMLAALAGLIGSTDVDELKTMRRVVESVPHDEREKAIAGIDALLSVLQNQVMP